MSDQLATRTFRAAGDASATARTIFSGSGILLNVIVANTAATDDLVNFEDEDGTVLFSINAFAVGSMDWGLVGGIVLDNGLVAVTTSGAATTIVSAAYRPQ